jgi:hypothetical protein
LGPSATISVQPEVLAEQVQEAMLGRRQTLDEAKLNSERGKRAKAQLARLERDLRERFRTLHQKVQESQLELGITPESVERAVTTGLRLGRQAPLAPVTIPAKDSWPEVRGFEVPPLTRSWARAAADLWDPITERNLPITFDPPRPAAAASCCSPGVATRRAVIACPSPGVVRRN